jgi:hypothetical protein
MPGFCQPHHPSPQTSRGGGEKPESAWHRARMRARLLGAVRAAAESLFAEDDRRAGLHGWQVQRGPWGLSRTYRDLRFGDRQSDVGPGAAPDSCRCSPAATASGSSRCQGGSQ